LQKSSRYAVAYGIAPSNSLETAQWNPFEAVSRIDDWFDKLNKKFDEIVRTEPNKQLIGSIDDLLTVLNAIETGTQIIEAKGLKSIRDVRNRVTEFRTKLLSD